MARSLYWCRALSFTAASVVPFYHCLKNLFILPFPFIFKVLAGPDPLHYGQPAYFFQFIVCITYVHKMGSQTSTKRNTVVRKYKAETAV